MGFYYHLFMVTFLPCFYVSRTTTSPATVAPYPIRGPFGKIK